MNTLSVRTLLLLCCVILFASPALAQTWPGSSIPRSLRGDENVIARGILDGNLIETNFRNHGEMSRWDDLPWGVWPRGIGGRHIDGIGVIVSAQVPGERLKWPAAYPSATSDTTLNPVIIKYRQAGTRTGPGGLVWGWLPLPGFNNPNRTDPITFARTPVPALSNDETSWPLSWPDRLDNPDDPGWAGTWNGFFGKGVFNADLESYYVMDDLSDQEYGIDPTTNNPNSAFGVFYPSPSDSTMGGLGMQTRVRLFQWANVLAEDIMFMLYRITNIGETSHDRLYFSQVQDYGLGNEEGDENAAFDPQSDVVFGWDQDGIGTRASGGTYKLGYTGFAFLESPARDSDGLDNDEDGMTDESRFSGPGSLIEGADAIRNYINGNYNTDDFVRACGRTGDTPAQAIERCPALQAGRWWTGDENVDWVGYTDTNQNGSYDAGELVNNDVGLDGLGPFDQGYPGPDQGEADGIPTVGEPNFDELDIDESDQIGLTGFDLNTRPFYENGDNLRDDTWMWDRIALSQFVLGTKPEAFQADIEPFTLFNSGPISLATGETDFFSIVWVFGEDEDDFFKNRRTAQSIFNADYQFAQPPFLPTLTAVPGDGRVTLSWDTLAVASFDRFTQEFDFEGFKLYKGTDNLLSDARLISDLNGTPTFYKPLAQYDLIDGIKGPVSVLGGEAAYSLGNDTGLKYFYIDEDVRNGITYYYALVAYDRGFTDSINPDADPIDPQENVFNVSVNQAGNLTGFSQNAAVVTPRSAPGGFIQGGANEDLSEVTRGIGSGSIGIRLLLESDAKFDGVYQVEFFSEEVPNTALYKTTAFQVRNVAANEIVFNRSPLVEVSPNIDGFTIEFFNDEEPEADLSRTGYVSNQGSPNELHSTNPTTLDGLTTNWFAQIREDTTGAGQTSPFDFELRWVAPTDSLYRPDRLFGFLREEIPIFAVNATKKEAVDLLIEDKNGSGIFDPGDDLIIFERVDGSRRFRYRITFSAIDPNNSVPPSPGDVLRISAFRPFATGDMFQFTLRESVIDADSARSTLDQIGVVPNPYFGASGFEPRAQIEGRGERRIQFINLPPQCTIKIFNIRGELIRTLDHSGGLSDGAEFWDLRTEGQQDVAFGVYIFHVDAPGIGTHVGKFALVK